MLATHHRRPPARRGAILIVVLAMLALFAVVGLSFVLYAESQASAARNNTRAYNDDDRPEPVPAAEYALGQIVFGTDDLVSIFRGHGLADSRFGFDHDTNPLTTNANVLFTPYAGTGIPAETLTVANQGAGWNFTLDRRRVINFTRVNTDFANPVPTTWFVVDPQRQTDPDGPGPQPGVVRDQAWTPPANSPFLPGTFVNKAVPATYPDRGNFYLAMMDPASGQVVVKSFHRDDLFLNTNPAFTGNPNEQQLRIQNSLTPPGQANFNPQWTSADGRLMIARPRPEDHRYNPLTRRRVAPNTPNGPTSKTDFPYPPANADGTYTGDLSNLRFITGSQRNDSVWLYAGAPVKTWRGKKYTTLVAPLVLDLNGRVNLSVVGNVRPTGGGTPVQGRHTSNQGWGPWEVSPRALFLNDTPAGTADAEVLAVLRARSLTNGPGASPQQDPYYGSGTGRLGHSPFVGGTLTTLLPPHYGRVDPDGVSQLVPNPDPIQAPGANTFSPFPTFPARYPNTQALLTGSGLVNHPMLFNPTMYMRGKNGEVPTQTHPLGLDDLVRTGGRYSDAKSRQLGAAVAQAAPNNLGYNLLPGQPGYDPTIAANAARARAMTTLYGFTQQAAEVIVRSVSATPGPNVPASAARLGPVDVNRQLPEFRKNPALPFSPDNNYDPIVPAEAPYYVLARQARQALARDIFVRLAALAGLINGTLNPNTGNPDPNPNNHLFYEAGSGYLVGGYNPALTPPRHDSISPAHPQFANLRLLAQYAANLVDFTDPDDVATAFAWNPDRTTVVNFPVALTPTFDPSWVPANLNAATLGQRAVYGTELPRLVINEAYAALFNDLNHTGGRAMANMRKGYFLELHNPLSPTGAVGGLDPALSDGGAARLMYKAGVTPGYTKGVDFAPYAIVVASQNQGQTTPFSTALATDPGNVTGDPAPNGTPVAGLDAVRLQLTSYDWATDNMMNQVPPGPQLTGDDLYKVLPANNQPTGPGRGNRGYYVIAPVNQSDRGAFPDDTGAMVPSNKVADNAANSLAYDTGGRNEAHIDQEVAKASVVLLRRLADPYRPFDAVTNPYLTVDYAENVPTRDRVLNNDDLVNNTHTPDGTNREAPTIGRLHPYAAGPTFLTGAGTEAWRVQTSNPNQPTDPDHSFFQRNDTVDNNRGPVVINGNNVSFGFEWLVHLDRQLINAQEMQHVSVVAPHSLTHQFWDGNGTYHRHVSIRPAAPYHPLLRDPFSGNALFRAPDLIQAGSSVVGVPVGGREAGKLNINTMAGGPATPHLLQAVLDPQEGNWFRASDPNLVTNVWAGMTSAQPWARSPDNGVPRATADEGGADRPFKGLAGGAFEETLYRGTTPGGASPFTATHPNPYFQNDALRKMWNNTSTVSDSFLVVMTVGFFEVINDGPYNEANPPILGKELYETVPGDFRAQFAAVVDRSNVMRTAPVAGMSGLGQVQRLTKLARDAHIGGNTITVEALPGPAAGQFTLYDNGVALTYGPGALPYPTVQLGYGSTLALPPGVPGDGETVTITGAAQAQTQTIAPQPVPGQVTLTLSANLTRFHGAGTRVANGLVGHPGPQPGFSVTGTNYQLYNGVVPFFTRLEQ